jgi:protein-ribulosamine 3-kinase
MTVPAPVLRGVEAALEERTGQGREVRRATPVGGGCINPSARLEVEFGEAFFLKWNPSASSAMFAAEADGLGALLEGASAASLQTGLHVPEVLGWGGSGTASDPGWLLLEWIPRGSAGPDYGRRLGQGLAALHASASDDTTAEPFFGWHQDNFIGSLPQGNASMETWAAFWRDRRLEPQLRMARDRGYLGGGQGRVLDQLLTRMEQVMEGAGASGPALLHGDLWAGNYYAGPDGEPVLIDPAVYRGAGEVDLAMMELFGSLPHGFREGYGDVRPLDPEYDRSRRDLYQLYYLMVHVNLFGGSYVSGSLAAATRVLRSV